MSRIYKLKIGLCKLHSRRFWVSCVRIDNGPTDLSVQLSSAQPRLLAQITQVWQRFRPTHSLAWPVWRVASTLRFNSIGSSVRGQCSHSRTTLRVGQNAKIDDFCTTALLEALFSQPQRESKSRAEQTCVPLADKVTLSHKNQMKWCSETRYFMRLDLRKAMHSSSYSLTLPRCQTSWLKLSRCGSKSILSLSFGHPSLRCTCFAVKMQKQLSPSGYTGNSVDSTASTLSPLSEMSSSGQCHHPTTSTPLGPRPPFANDGNNSDNSSLCFAHDNDSWLPCDPGSCFG